jgi:hypothetical protein
MGRFAALLIVGVSAIIALAGCTFTDFRLRRSVLTQASTLTDLQYQQVLGNLAMMSLDPDAIPTHVNIRDGSAQVQDNGVLSSASPASLYPSASGSRTLVAQWTMIPVTDDVEWRLLRLAYRRALGFEEELDIGLANDLAHELCNRVSNSDFTDLRSDTNLNVRLLAGAELFKDLKYVNPDEAKLKAMLKPRTIDPEIKWLPDINAPVVNPSVDALDGKMKNVILLALDGNRVLHIRTADSKGTVTDRDETNLPGKGALIAAIKSHLNGNARELSESEQATLRPLLEPVVCSGYIMSRMHSAS